MTKIKNTKKGMAKKTLSMSLVVAMLATSNVPVWAAEFSDGSEAAVATEAPAVTDTETSEFSDAATTEETPVAEDTTADAAQIDTAEDVNLEDYTIKDLKMSDVKAWGTESTAKVSVTGSIQDHGVDVTDLSYTWMANGVQAAGAGAVGTTTTGNVTTITYNPTIEDFQKTLSLRIYKLGKNGSVIFSQTITGGVVQAKDISNDLITSANASLSLPGVTTVQNKNVITYNGEEQKVSATNTYSVTKDSIGGTSVTIDNKNIDWHYETETNDFTNVTKKNIKVYGTIVGTTDRSSAAYGYTGTTAVAEYQIAPFVVDSTNYNSVTKVNLLKTSVEYTGTKTPEFGKKDIKLEINVSNDSNKEKNIDITAALKDDLASASIIGQGNETGASYNATAKLFSQFDDTDAAKAVLKNFDIKTTDLANSTVATENKYSVVKRDLSKCTGVIKKEYQPGVFRGDAGKNATISASDIELTGADGQKFTLDDISNDAVVQINNGVFNAANANPIQTGTIKNGVTVRYKNDSLNVTGSLDLDLNLVISSLANVTASVTYKDGSTTVANKSLPDRKADAANVTVPYTGKAYDIEDTKSTLSHDVYGLALTGVDLGAYSVSYNDNVNAGTVEVTVTGKGNYAGSTKKFYFKIAKDAVRDNEFKATSNTVTINPSNNKDASLYKDAIKPVFKTALADGTNAVLEEGKDYTVKYYYGKDGATSVDDLTGDSNKVGANKVGDYVYAVATLAKNGNYESSDSFIYAKAEITKKSISNVTVTVDKDSYVYTGKEIVPDVTVKDGSVTLVKGEDYTLKFKDNINVGTATAYVVPTITSDYSKDTTATTTFKIEAAKAEDVKVTLKANASSQVSTDNTFPYTGKQVKPVVAEVTLNGQNVTKDFDVEYPTYGENVNAGKEAGSITITPKTSNFTGTKTQLFNIQGKELTGALKVYNTDKSVVGVWSDIAYHTVGLQSKFYSFYYDGTAQTFGSEVFTADATLSATKDKDYEIKYINNTDAGYAFVAVVAKGNYEANTRTTTFNNLLGDYKVTAGKLYKGNKVIQNNIVDIIAFNIEPSYFTAKNITVANGTYAGGIPVKPQVTVTVNGKTLVEGTDYTLTLTAIKGEATPDKFVDVTTDKPYYVTINAKGGYKFDQVNGTNTYVWGIDKKDLKDCVVSVDKDLNATVMNGNVVEKKEAFEVKANGDGTATVSVVDGGKNYTGSVKVNIGEVKVGTPMISNVVVKGNTVTPVLSSEVDGAVGYDYVISTEEDYKNGRVGVSKNILKTNTDFHYVQQGTYYAYCHAWTRGADGKKVFGEWSNIYKFTVKATTPSTPKITKVTVKGNTVTVTYTKSSDATGYDVILGSAVKSVNGEKRPVDYGTLVKKNIKGNVVTATFKNVPAGKYYAGVHSFNKTSEDGKKVFSKWSNSKAVTVK